MKIAGASPKAMAAARRCWQIRTGIRTGERIVRERWRRRGFCKKDFRGLGSSEIIDLASRVLLPRDCRANSGRDIRAVLRAIRATARNWCCAAAGFAFDLKAMSRAITPKMGDLSGKS